MSLETSTINLLLGAIVGLQAWVLLELINLKTALAAIKEHCRICKKHENNDLD